MSKVNYTQKITLAEAKFKLNRQDLNKTKALGRQLIQGINKEINNPEKTWAAFTNAKMFLNSNVLQSDDIHYRNRSYDNNQNNCLAIANGDGSKNDTCNDCDGNTSLSKEDQAQIYHGVTNGIDLELTKYNVHNNDIKYNRTMQDNSGSIEAMKDTSYTSKVQIPNNGKNSCLKKIGPIGKKRLNLNVPIKEGKSLENQNLRKDKDFYKKDFKGDPESGLNLRGRSMAPIEVNGLNMLSDSYIEYQMNLFISKIHNKKYRSDVDLGDIGIFGNRKETCYDIDNDMIGIDQPIMGKFPVIGHSIKAQPVSIVNDLEIMGRDRVNSPELGDYRRIPLTPRHKVKDFMQKRFRKIARTKEGGQIRNNGVL